MNLDYELLTKIRRAVALYTTRKTSNILEGDYRSIYKSRSMDFEDLKEYTLGDEVHDIDWKSSSRMGTTLVRRYMTDRRHNVMFVCDCGSKMMGDTAAGESKKELALTTFGTIAYISQKNGADVALAYPCNNTSAISIFKSDTAHLEKLMYEYDKHIFEDANRTVEQTLKDVVDSLHKHMIIVLITDMESLGDIDPRVIKAVTQNNDLLVMALEDAMLTGDNVYDLGAGNYERFFLSHSKALHEYEIECRQATAGRINDACIQSRVSVVSVAAAEQIIDNTIILFERYKNGDYGYITARL